MVQRQVEFKIKSGLQARPAAKLVQEANRFSADIFIEKSGKKVNAKSIMGLMSLSLSAGSTVTILAEGNDETEALNKLTAFMQEDII